MKKVFLGLIDSIRKKVGFRSRRSIEPPRLEMAEGPKVEDSPENQDIRCPDPASLVFLAAATPRKANGTMEVVKEAASPFNDTSGTEDYESTMSSAEWDNSTRSIPVDSPGQFALVAAEESLTTEGGEATDSFSSATTDGGGDCPPQAVPIKWSSDRRQKEEEVVVEEQGEEDCTGCKEDCSMAESCGEWEERVASATHTPDVRTPDAAAETPKVDNETESGDESSLESMEDSVGGIGSPTARSYHLATGAIVDSPVETPQFVDDSDSKDEDEHFINGEEDAYEEDSFEQIAQLQAQYPPRCSQWRAQWEEAGGQAVAAQPARAFYPTVWEEDEDGFWEEEPLGFSRPALAPTAPSGLPSLVGMSEDEVRGVARKVIEEDGVSGETDRQRNQTEEMPLTSAAQTHSSSSRRRRGGEVTPSTVSPAVGSAGGRGQKKKQGPKEKRQTRKEKKAASPSVASRSSSSSTAALRFEDDRIGMPDDYQPDQREYMLRMFTGMGMTNLPRWLAPTSEEHAETSTRASSGDVAAAAAESEGRDGTRGGRGGRGRERARIEEEEAAAGRATSTPVSAELMRVFQMLSPRLSAIAASAGLHVPLDCMIPGMMPPPPPADPRPSLELGNEEGPSTVSLDDSQLSQTSQMSLAEKMTMIREASRLPDPVPDRYRMCFGLDEEFNVSDEERRKREAEMGPKPDVSHLNVFERLVHPHPRVAFEASMELPKEEYYKRIYNVVLTPEEMEEVRAMRTDSD